MVCRSCFSHERSRRSRSSWRLRSRVQHQLKRFDKSSHKKIGNLASNSLLLLLWRPIDEEAMCMSTQQHELIVHEPWMANNCWPLRAPKHAESQALNSEEECEKWRQYRRKKPHQPP